MFNQIQISLGKLYEKLSGWISDFILALPNILVALMVMGISYFLAQYLKKGVQKAMFKTTKNRTVSSVISSMVVAAFMVVSLFIVLNILNLSDAVTALLGTAGVIGLAIGLALQDPLTNLFSGVMMSVRENFNIGDLIETNGHFGTIQKITLRSTVLTTPEGQQVVIPNKSVIQNPLINYTVSRQRRVDIDCGVSYNDDLRKVRKVAIQAIANANIDRDNTRPIEVFFKAFGGSSIDFTLRFWNNSTYQKDFLESRNDAIIALKRAFDEHDITIPFPITTLDFGIEGGVRLDEVFPLENRSLNGNGQN